MRRGIVEVIDRYPRKPLTGKWSDIHYYPLVPIADIHLSPTGAFAMTPGGDPRTIRAMAVVGVLVLLLASINFVNLKTARAARRAVEVGVRKVCGAGRRDLIVQFAILIGLMLSTAIIYRQTQFGLDQGLRFDTGQLLIVDVPSADCEKSSFRTAVDNLPGVLGAACSEFFLGEFGTAQYLAPDGREVTLHDGIAGAGMFEIMGLKPVAGRFFMRNREADVLPPPKDRKPGVPFAKRWARIPATSCVCCCGSSRSRCCGRTRSPGR